jgi:hypothetical protein
LLLDFRHVRDLHYNVCSCHLDVFCLLFESIIGLDYTVEQLAEKVDGLLHWASRTLMWPILQRVFK